MISVSVLHVRGDGSSRFLHIQLSSALGLPVKVLSNGRVEALCVAANVSNDERVAAAFLEDSNVVALFDRGL